MYVLVCVYLVTKYVFNSCFSVLTNNMVNLFKTLSNLFCRRNKQKGKTNKLCCTCLRGLLCMFMVNRILSIMSLVNHTLRFLPPVNILPYLCCFPCALFVAFIHGNWKTVCSTPTRYRFIFIQPLVFTTSPSIPSLKWVGGTWLWLGMNKVIGCALSHWVVKRPHQDGVVDRVKVLFVVQAFELYTYLYKQRRIQFPKWKQEVLVAVARRNTHCTHQIHFHFLLLFYGRGFCIYLCAHLHVVHTCTVALCLFQYPLR